MKHAALVLLLALSVTGPLRAAHWPQWRGPSHDGSSPERGVPATFSRTENDLWDAPLPGPSGATPVVRGDHVFMKRGAPKATNGAFVASFSGVGGATYVIEYSDSAFPFNWQPFTNMVASASGMIAFASTFSLSP